MILRAPRPVRIVFGAGAAALLLVSLAGFWGDRAFVLEWAGHLRVQLLVCAALALALAVFAGSRLAFAFACAAALINVGFILAADSASLHPQNAVGEAPIVTVIWANLQERPRSLARIAALAEQEAADVVALTELPPGGALAAAKALRRYPCLVPSAVAPRRLTTVIFARTCASPRAPAATREVAVMELEGFRLVAAHPPPPITQDLADERDRLIAAALAARSRAGPTLLVGDFNTTAYAQALRPFPRAGFTRARCGDALTTTWNNPNPVLGLAIDHAFLRGGLRLVSCAVGPWNGSDHAPLIVRVQVG